MGLFDFFKEKDDGNTRRRPIGGERELPDKKPFEKPAGAQPM